MDRQTAKGSTFLKNIRDTYRRWFRTILLTFTILTLSGAALIILYFMQPSTPVGQLYLNIGSALATGAVFSIVLPVFIPDPRGELDDDPHNAIANRYSGMGRVWVNENDFTSTFSFEEHFRNPAWTEAVFVGISLTRFFSLYGHIVESIYREQAPERWRKCYFIVADPDGEYLQAHARSEFGRAEAPREVLSSIDRIREIRAAVARHWGCNPADIPLVMKTTRSQIRWGLFFFSERASVITLYRFGSRSYFNPRFEILHSQPGGRAPTALGEWVANYVSLVKERSEIVS